MPAYFNNAQREATKDAGKIAGLNVLRIINEPTAAALAYGLDKEGAEHTILVFDLGGGTFDVSVLELGEGVYHVKATNGDNHLGGDNFDKAIVDWMIAEFKRDQGIDLGQDPMALQRLYEAGEKAKIELSSTMTTQINLPFITATPEGPKHLDLQLTRAKLDELTHDLLERTVGPTKQALADAGLTPSDIEHVVLVGGMTRMPAVQAKVKELIGKDPHKGVNPDEVVAVGAAIQAGVLKRRGQGRPPARRHSALARDRDEGRRVHEAHRPQHDDPYAEVRDVHDGRGQPAIGGDPRRAGRVRDGQSFNKTLGKFQLVGIPPAMRGMPQIDVSFDIDANGIINVSAKDLGTGNEQQIRIEGGSGLNEDEVDRMIKDAEAHAGEAHQLRELADASNAGEQLAYQTERTLAEHRDKLPESDAATIEGRIMELRQALEGSDLADIQAKTTALEEATPRARRRALCAGAAGGAGRCAAVRERRIGG